VVGRDLVMENPFQPQMNARKCDRGQEAKEVAQEISVDIFLRLADVMRYFHGLKRDFF